MTTLRAYATLAQYKAYVTARGQTTTTDSADDAVIEQLLKAASRYAENKTGRIYYPRVQTRYFSVPDEECEDPRELELDADLLEVFTVTNGNGTVLASTEYDLKPRNETPYSSIRLKDSSIYYWAPNSSGNSHDVISVSGIWAYHDLYSRAWLDASTLNEDLDTSETGIDVVAGSAFSVGNIARCDDEIFYVSGIATNTLTATRGENDSTAATHDNGTTVKIFVYMEDLNVAVMETAARAYGRRFGESAGGSATITAAGVVLSPKDIPSSMSGFINDHKRWV